MTRYRKMFIACPISKYIVEGGIDQKFLAFIQPIYGLCQNHAQEVFFALEREQYGAAIMDGAICTPLDHQAMVECDLVLAFPEDSMGVAVELGWASALGKSILLVLEEPYTYSPLITAIHSVTRARYISLPPRDRDLSVVLGHLDEELRNFAPGAVQSRPTSVI